MTVSQLRRALKGLPPDLAVLVFDGVHSDLRGQAEISVMPTGSLVALRLLAVDVTRKEIPGSATWRTVE